MKNKLVLYRVVHIVTFKIPYYGLCKLIKTFGGDKAWNNFSLRDMVFPKLMPDGNKIICQWKDHGVAWSLYYDSQYDRFFEPQRGNIVVDAGAHVGVYALKTARKVGYKGLVVAIEPYEINYQFLLKNISINNYGNIIPVKCALANFEGRAKFFIKASNVSHSLVKASWNSPIVKVIEVDVTTLDSLLRKLGIDKVDLLKINVEGAELEVLKGSKSYLSKRQIFNIVLTTHPPHEQEARKVAEYLKTFSYKIKVVNLRGRKVIYATCGVK